jgi:hypothetical protein
MSGSRAARVRRTGPAYLRTAPKRPVSVDHSPWVSNSQATALLSRPVARTPLLFDVSSALALQRAAGNAAFGLLVQRCGGHPCEGACTDHEEATAQRSPDPQTTTQGPQPAPEELKPLCDFDKLRKTIPEKGDSDPTPGAKDAIDDADVAWVDDLKPPGLARWLMPQIDMPYTVGPFERRAETWVAACETPARNKVKAIKDPAKRQAAQETLDKQLALDRAELATVVSEYTSRTAVGRANYRKAFMRTMRCLLGPDPATKNHFSALEEVTPGLWLDAEAAGRIRQVRTALQAVGHDIPSTDVGQGLRGHHLTNHSTGWWGHALGFSIDFFAYENPHITDPRTSRLVDLLTGGADRMKFTGDAGDELDYGARRAIIRSIGEKSAAGEDPTADPAFARFLDQVDQQYLGMVAGSRKLQDDLTVLPADNRRELEQLKHDYVDLYEQIVGARGDVAAQEKELTAARRTARTKLVKAATAAGVKAAKIDDATVDADADVAPVAKKLADSKKKLDDLVARQAALKDRLPKIFEPWLARIKAEFLDLDAAAAKQGVVAAQLPDLKGWRFNQIEAVLKKMAAREGQVPEDRRATDPQLKSLRAQIARDLGKIADALSDPTVVTRESSAEVLKRVVLVRSFVWKRNDRPTMQSLYDGLRGDLTYTLGVVQAVPKQYQRAGGDRYWLRPGYGFDQPVPIAQLLEKPGDRNAKLRVGGYIRSDNDKAGFNQLFVRTMVQYGWEPGAAWLPGSVDTMHFDFVKAFDRVKIGGNEQCGPRGKV